MLVWERDSPMTEVWPPQERDIPGYPLPDNLLGNFSHLYVLKFVDNVSVCKVGRVSSPVIEPYTELLYIETCLLTMHACSTLTPIKTLCRLAQQFLSIKRKRIP